MNRLSSVVLMLVLAASCGKRGADDESTKGLPDVSSAEPLFLVTDSPYQIWQGEATKVHVAVYGKQFAPAQGARIFLGNDFIGETDADGTLIFDHKPGGNQRLWAILDTEGKRHAGSVRMTAYSRTSSFESANLFVYTDRGVYRPGEDVLLRVFNWKLRGDFTPIENAKVEVVLLDPGSTTVTGAALTTDAFGVGSTSLRVPEDAVEGAYTLTVRYEGAEESARLRVKRFRAPAIDIQHNLPRFVAPKTEDLAVEIKLAYFSGGAPSSGQLSAQALHEGKVLFETTQPVRKDQPVAFTLPLEPVRTAVPPGQRFQIKLTATDAYRRSDELERDVLYAVRPYVAVPDLDKDAYAVGEQVTLSVRLVDPDGIPVREKELTLSGDNGKIQITRRTDTGGVAVFQFDMPDHGFQLSVHAADVDEPLCVRHVRPPLRKPMQAELEDPVVKERKPTPVTVTFDPGFVPVEKVVHLDVTDYSGAVVGGFKIPIHESGDGYRAAGSFPAPAWGSMLITLFTVGRPKDQAAAAAGAESVGLLTEGLSLTSHPDKELRIHLDGIPDRAAPRSQLTASFSVQDPRKKQVTALLGVMLVDRAVLSLMDPLEKTPMDRFYNPTLKVLSTTGSDILTWPVVSRNWGHRNYDIALPPFGYLPGGPVLELRREDSATKGLDMLKSEVAAPAGAAPPAPPEAVEEEPDGVAAADDAREAGRGGGPKKPPGPAIVIRTELPATSLWEPALLAEGGRAELAMRMPEAITEQEIIAVASDKQGGLGVLRKAVRVTKPLFVRSDLPRTMTAGDRIEAGVYLQNSGEVDLEARVAIESDGLQVSPALRKVSVAANTGAVAWFQVSAPQPGTLRYTVEASAGDQTDAERRELEVRPRGNAVTEEIVATLQAQKPFKTSVMRSRNEFVEAHLQVAFPTLVPALQEIDTLLERSAWWADGHLATAHSVAHLEAYLARHLPDHPGRKQLRTYLDRVARELPRIMNHDGGTSWWRTGSASQPFATAWALRLMTALRDADIAVDQAILHGAVGYLRRTRAEDGLWDTSAVAFWEGDTQKVRLQIAAGIFRSLAEASRVAELSGDRAWITELAERFARYLDGEPDDPLTASEAALGWWALNQAGRKPPEGPDRERLLRTARHLEQLRKKEHWEPSWFHAYGGTIEATVASLELLSRLDPQGFGDSLRSGLMYLLSTRSEWGGWHCPFGTAEAIRAFTLLPPPGKEIASVVSVRLRDAEIARVEVDPDDPYLSALRLRHVAFGSLLQPGSNPLEIRYDGKLEVPMRLVVRRYRPGVATRPAGPSLKRKLARNRLRQGEPVEVSLHLDARKSPGVLLLTSPVPANARLVSESLDELKKTEGILAVQPFAGGLQVLVAGGAERVLAFRIEAVRTGKATLPPAEVRSTLRPGLATVTKPDTIVVKP